MHQQTKKLHKFNSKIKHYVFFYPYSPGSRALPTHTHTHAHIMNGVYDSMKQQSVTDLGNSERSN